MTNTMVFERRWRRIFRDHRASGQSVAAFCRQARVSQASFYAWRRRLRSAVGFVEVRLPPETATETRAIELRLPCGRCVIIRPGFDPSTLRDLLATLESCTSPGGGLAANQ